MRLQRKTYAISPRSLGILVIVFRFFGVSNGRFNPRTGELSTCHWVWSLITLVYLVLDVHTIITAHRRPPPDEFIVEQWLTLGLMASTFYLYWLDNVFNVVYFSFIGGQRVCHHLSEFTVLNRDLDYRLSVRILFNLISRISLANLVASLISHFMTPMESRKTIPNVLMHLVWVIFVNIRHISGHYVTVIYCYTMHAYWKQLCYLGQRYQCDDEKTIVALGSKQLDHIRRDLRDLSFHYRKTWQMLQTPILITVLCHTGALVSGACLLVTSAALYRPYSGFVLYVLLLSTLRLFLLAHFGTLVPCQFDYLMWRVRQSLPTVSWNRLTWLQNLQIKSFRVHFLPRVFGMFTLDQSLLIAILTVVLTHLVMLIQIGNQTSRAGHANHTKAF